MIRGVAAVLGLALGLVAAALSEARMGHLRMLAGDALPHWSTAIADDARLRRGRAAPGNPDPHGAVLQWALDGVDRDGLRWRVELTAPGARLEARARLAPAAPRNLRLSEFSGAVELAPLTAAAHTESAAALDADGRIALQGGQGRFDLRAGRLAALEAQGALEAVTIAGRDFGAGPARLELTSAPDWSLRAGLEGRAGAARLEAQGSGAGAAITLALEDPDALPRDWRTQLGMADGVLRATLPGPG